MDKWDGLSELVCDGCGQELNNFHFFKLQVLKSDNILRCIVRNRQEEKRYFIEEESKESETVCYEDEDTQCDNEIINVKNSAATEGTFQCGICKKQVKTIHSLRRHLKIHSGEKTHVCSLCKKAFVEPGNLTKHMRKHTKDKKHQCNECGLRFYERNKLMIHLRTHTGEKPYSCSVCNRPFATLGQVQIHMKVNVSCWTNLIIFIYELKKILKFKFISTWHKSSNNRKSPKIG